MRSNGFEVIDLGGGRSMAKFMRDLYRMPDKVEAVLDVIQKYTIESLR
ncbi:hypothetical protein [Clostridium thailandense]|nr:hypothetical protein [Clostridium thailandense]